jgi:hypothetical protein
LLIRKKCLQSLSFPIPFPSGRVRERQVFSGDSRGGETPLPIPNREVKPLIADGTTTARLWESRSLPGFILKAPVVKAAGAFFIYDPLSHSAEAELRESRCHFVHRDKIRPLQGFIVKHPV